MKKFIKMLIALVAMGLIVLSVSSCGDSDGGSGADTDGENVTQTYSASDEAYVVTETAEYDKLVIEEGATVTSATGYSLTLTLDGVEQQGCSVDTIDIEGNAGAEQASLDAGTWEGDVVITVTENIQIDFSDSITNYFRAALYVEDGAVVEGKSVTAAIASGSYDGSSATDVNITSVGEAFNGIFVNSSAESTERFNYEITDPVINFTGNGGNDFAGYGALIMADGYADVTVVNADLTSTGAARNAVFVGGDATINVTDSIINSYNGTLPEDYTMTVAMGKMSEIPWALGCTGNNRSTNIVDTADATYQNCTITTEGWGSLSTDMCTTITLTSIGNSITVTDSGYGSYTIGDCEATYSDTDFIVPDMAVIQRSGNITFDQGTTVDSDRYGIMQHAGCTGQIDIKDSSVFTTAEAIINAKGSWPTPITIDNATLTPENGILFQFVEDDDPIGQGIQNGYITMSTLVTLADEEEAPEGPPGGPPGGSSGPGSSDVTITNATLSGDIVNGVNSEGTLDGLVTVTIGENATLTGAITTSDVDYGWELAGYEDLLTFFTDIYATEGYTGSGNYTYDGLQGVDLVGYVEFNYGSQSGDTSGDYTDSDYGVAVNITSGGTWTVDTTSYISSLYVESGSTLNSGTVTVDGTTTTIVPGTTYTGTIVVNAQ